mmetsp:Transcript_22249/g.48332  ORF Transcript_22249/g.48332 Transcript_22249/m.48332 type:complete len:332 (-) Transcript_22249:222-1217(-)
MIRVRPVNRPNNAIDNVINVSVIPARAAISKLLQFQSARDTVNELEGRHVRPATRSIYGEETQSRHIQFVEVMVSVSQQLARLLGSSIRRYRIVNTFILAEERILGSTIDTRRGSKNKVLDAEFMAQLHEMCCSTDIRMNVHIRILNRGTHSRTGSHVADPLWTLLLEQGHHKFLVANVAFVNGQALLIRAKLAKTTEVVLLETNIIIIVHLIDNDDSVAAFEESSSGRRADEASASGDEDLLESKVRLQGRGPARRVLGFVIGFAQLVEIYAGLDVWGRTGTNGGRRGSACVIHALIAGRTGRIFVACSELGHTFGVAKRHDMIYSQLVV